MPEFHIENFIDIIGILGMLEGSCTDVFFFIIFIFSKNVEIL